MNGTFFCRWLCWHAMCHMIVEFVPLKTVFGSTQVHIGRLCLFVRMKEGMFLSTWLAAVVCHTVGHRHGLRKLLTLGVATCCFLRMLMAMG
jgi:hypothetical protein